MSHHRDLMENFELNCSLVLGKTTKSSNFKSRGPWVTLSWKLVELLHRKTKADEINVKLSMTDLMGSREKGNYKCGLMGNWKSYKIIGIN